MNTQNVHLQLVTLFRNRSTLFTFAPCRIQNGSLIIFVDGSFSHSVQPQQPYYSVCCKAACRIQSVSSTIFCFYSFSHNNSYSNCKLNLHVVFLLVTQPFVSMLSIAQSLIRLKSWFLYRGGRFIVIMLPLQYFLAIFFFRLVLFYLNKAVRPTPA